MNGPVDVSKETVRFLISRSDITASRAWDRVHRAGRRQPRLMASTVAVAMPGKGHHHHARMMNSRAYGQHGPYIPSAAAQCRRKPGAASASRMALEKESVP